MLGVFPFATTPIASQGLLDEIEAFLVGRLISSYQGSVAGNTNISIDGIDSLIDTGILTRISEVYATLTSQIIVSSYNNLNKKLDIELTPIVSILEKGIFEGNTSVHVLGVQSNLVIQDILSSLNIALISEELSLIKNTLSPYHTNALTSVFGSLSTGDIYILGPRSTVEWVLVEYGDNKVLVTKPIYIALVEKIQNNILVEMGNNNILAENL